MPEVTLERAGPVARLTLDRPPLNLLTPELIGDLAAAAAVVAADPELRVVVVAGRGRAFSAGVDVRAMRDLEPAAARSFIAALHDAIAALRGVPVPVLARLHGHALGGGLELALGCDLRLAAESCRLGMPEIRVGLPSVIEAALLPGLVGWGRAAELVLTGESISGEEAARWGLVNRAVPEDGLDREVDAWVARLLALPPRAVRLQKELLVRWREVQPAAAILPSMDAFAIAFATDEPRRAMDAFLARRRTSTP